MSEAFSLISKEEGLAPVTRRGDFDGNPNPVEYKAIFEEGGKTIGNFADLHQRRRRSEKRLSLVERIWADLNQYAMCRHSYVIVVGGGAAPTGWFCRVDRSQGRRLIRFPVASTLS